MGTGRSCDAYVSPCVDHCKTCRQFIKPGTGTKNGTEAQALLKFKSNPNPNGLTDLWFAATNLVHPAGDPMACSHQPGTPST